MPTTFADAGRPARRAAPRIVLALTGVALAASLPVRAQPVLHNEFEYDPGPALTTWYGPADPAAKRADLAYVAGMRPHHAGALTMSQDYLADPASSSPLLRQLARAIIVNQQFEVLLLDEVERNLNRPSLRLGPIALQPMATAGLAQARLFRRLPVPGAFTYATTPVSERDVQFAKAMIIHHQGAVSMARAYHADPAARNGFLGLFNVDVVTDQSQEIALMRRAITAYPGDAEAVRVDPSMIHGMEGMPGHGGHGGGHADHGAHGGGGTAAPAPHPAAPQPATTREVPPAPRPPAASRPGAPRPAPSGHEGHAHHH